MLNLAKAPGAAKLAALVPNSTIRVRVCRVERPGGCRTTPPQGEKRVRSGRETGS
jgi:hypothetical protein